ncbi:PREDICTED: uncharacterized protein LOC104803474 [Tarenaya hassleriana]|uniref:uncharacterized protein LOC104803474 n=1 Tax=Tarenaya hassleriana TaxID=28532 RepID=UPI00053C872D|nr:PREDICTED: uncharacterized protein LOC104803474 [Tarenaya hassleriana]XP_010525707.1 PREDICTED: uncharacterized protein LOC104803474 [Tarenaya hassleriana]
MPPKDQKDHRFEQLEETMHTRLGEFADSLGDLQGSVTNLQKECSQIPAMREILEKLCSMLDQGVGPSKATPDPMASAGLSTCDQPFVRLGKAPMDDQMSPPPQSPVAMAEPVLGDVAPTPDCALFMAGSELALKKIEMPVFEGVFVADWVAQAERYFAMGRVDEHEKIQLAPSAAVLRMAGSASSHVGPFRCEGGRKA